MIVTRVHYMYRDAHNYKQFGHIDLAGEMSDSQKRDVQEALHDLDGHFIPEQIGMRHLGRDSNWTSFPSDIDHCWHELDPDEFEILEGHITEPPTATVDEWVSKFTEAGAQGWDDGKYGIEFL